MLSGGCGQVVQLKFGLGSADRTGMNEPRNGQLIRYRMEDGRTAACRVDLGAPAWAGSPIERDAQGRVEWFRVRQDGVQAPFMVHVDDVVVVVG